MLATTDYIKTKLQAAIATAYELTDADPMLMPASNSKFGDFQCNAPLGLAKKVGVPPREVAQHVIDNLSLSDICETPTIGGPGFINLTLKRDVLESMTLSAFADPRLNITTVPEPKRVVIDFSSPNVAKEMHVGHLRSTIIGDSIARILEFLGHDVLRINHIGDWGTQFGMLIAYLKFAYPEALTTSEALDLGDLVALYRKAKAKFDEDEVFKETARKEVVALQSGDPGSRHAWQLLCAQSRKAFDQIYDILNVKIIERGESFYNPLLSAVVTDLDALGLLQESEGAKCVFPEGFTTRDGDPLPVIIQKSDGGYNYDTTDLAAIQYRIHEDHGDWLIYVTDAGQAMHFAQVFAVARLANWIPDTVRIDHVPFGLVLGEGGKKLKTRSGDTVRLIDLLEEAVDHARQDTETRLATEERTETEEYKDVVAKTLGIGAIKYADLSQNRISDYVFSYEKMLALQGNTAPYMIYAFVRVHGISRKGGIDFAHLADTLTLTLTEESELTLAKHLLRLDEILYAVSDDFLPSRLCQYLFELSQKFNRFYEACPVLIADEPARTSRLALCDLTARSLKLGLELLGIQVVDRL